MDKLTKAVTKDGFMRIYFANCRETVEKAREYHNLSPLASAVLGRTLVSGHLLGAMLKNEEATVTIQVKGGGPAGIILAVADAKGGVKGYIENPMVDLPLNRVGKLDVGGAVGKNGFLSVIRDLKMKEPYIGQVPLQTGEIGDDMAFYFAQSEQVPSVVALGVLVDKDLSVKASGGFIVQVMPDCDEFSLARLEKSIQGLKSVTALLEDGMSSEDIIKYIMEGFEIDILERKEVGYKCDCSRDRTYRAIKSLGKDEIKAILEEDGRAEVNCHFCSKSYLFGEEELKSMIEEIENKR